MIRHPRTFAGAAGALVAALATTMAVAGQPAADLLERWSPSLVAVRALVKAEIQMSGQGRDEESTLDTLGVVVDPGGLVMVSNLPLSAARLSEVMSALGMGDFELSLTPTDFQVFLPGEEKGRPALLAAVDRSLDLAFLQLDEPPPAPLPAVDFAQAGAAVPGDTVVAISRLNESFAYAPYLEVYRVAGELTKPRKAWVIDGNPSALGLPVFGADGRPVGVLSTIVSTGGSEASRRSSGLGPLGSLEQRKTLGPFGIFILPAEPVARAVEQSRLRAAELLQEKKEAGEGEMPAASPQEPAAAPAP